MAPGAAWAQVHTLFELGTGYDLTNEIYYDQPFDSTAIVPRQQVSDTDGRILALGAARVDLKYRGGSLLSIDQLLQAGPELAHEQLHVNWRHATTGDWRWLGGADVDYRHDTSFELTRDDFQAEARVGAELAPADYSSSLRMLYRFDAGDSKTEGGQSLYPDFFYHRAQVSYSRFAWLGSEWGVSGTLGARSFPDTSARDYLDFAGEGYGRMRLESGTEFSARAWIDRRDARSDSATGDRFIQSDLEASVRQPISLESWWLTLGGRYFGTVFDVPTSSFFNNALARLYLQPRYEAGPSWALETTLEWEGLRVPDDGGLVGEDAQNALREEFNQGRLGLGFERLGEAAFFLEPSVGRRVYRIETRDQEDLLSRSSYWFVSANGYADARLTHHVRLRASVDYLYEFHDVAADDLSAVFLTAELRYALGR